nr:MAG TPA: hypothetical protein [Caudoviricetes sp.]
MELNEIVLMFDPFPYIFRSKTDYIFTNKTIGSPFSLSLHDSR